MCDQLRIVLIDRLLIAGLLVLLGFLLNRSLEKAKHALGLAAKKHELALKSQIDFMERQLSDYYGPIYALLKQIRPLDDLWNEKRLGPAEANVVAGIKKANERIVDIVVTRSHLVHGASIPDSFTRFLTHVTVWHAFMDAPQADWSVYRSLPEAHYDPEFEKEIYRVTEFLKGELTALRGQFAAAVG